MRKLTIKRKWSMVECGSRIYLYVQCAKANSTDIIGDTYYNKMRIKNGKTVELEILDVPTKLIVASSTAQTEYTVPEGSDDVKLMVRPHYCLSEGNPFTFEKL